MRRMAFAERPDWRNILLDSGFPPDAPPGRAQWAEDACWVIGRQEAEALAEAAAAVERLCRDVVDRATRSEALLDRLGIPEFMRDAVVNSWRAGQPPLLGRIDLDPAGRLLGCDADPAGLHLAAAVQAGWLPAEASQYGDLTAALTEAWRGLAVERRAQYFMAPQGDEAGRPDLLHLMDTAVRAGLETRFAAVETVALDGRGRLIDRGSDLILACRKALSWRDLLRQPFARAIPAAPTLWLEPPWKMIMAADAFPALLAEAHPDLAPASGGPAIGVWMVAGRPAGLSVVEAGRFLPHYLEE